MPVKKIKIGILGFANIAQRYVIPSILECSDLFKLVGIASLSTKNHEEISQKYNCVVLNNYTDIFSVKGLDAIYIPLPNSLHYPWIKQALTHKIHVLSEKSLACSFEEVQELNELAKNNGCALVENFQFRFHGQLDYIKSLLQTQKIGGVRCIYSRFGFPPFNDPQNIRYNKTLGGGALLDAGAYPIKLANELFNGDVKVVAASLSYEDATVDIWGGGTLTNSDKSLLMQFAFGFDNFYKCDLEIWGSLGTIKAERIFTSPPGQEAQVTLQNSEGTIVQKIPAENHFSNMLKYFYRCINDSTLKNKEYTDNILQSKLIKDFLNKSHE
jgi:NDP-hexose-3-ketoreductase